MDIDVEQSNDDSSKKRRIIKLEKKGNILIIYMLYIFEFDYINQF